MREFFLDTSAYAKLYHEEAGSQVVRQLLEHPACHLVISSLSLIEIESVLAIKIRTGELDSQKQALARRRLQADISQGRVHVGPTLSERHYRTARRLLMRHGTSMGLRTLDSMQLAVALELCQSGRGSVLVASDQRMCRVAEANGCETLDPTNPTVILP